MCGVISLKPHHHRITAGSRVEFKCVFGEDLILWVWLLSSMTFRASLFFASEYLRVSTSMSDFMKCTAGIWVTGPGEGYLGITFTSDGSMEHEVAGQVAADYCQKQSERSHQGGSWIRSLITVNLCSNVHLRSWALRTNLKNEVVQDCCGRPGSASEVGWGNHTSTELWAVPLRWKDPTDVLLGCD